MKIVSRWGPVRLTSACWRNLRACLRRHRTQISVIIGVIICINVILMWTSDTIFLSLNHLLTPSSENRNESQEIESRDSPTSDASVQDSGSREGNVLKMASDDVIKRCDLGSLLSAHKHIGTFNEEQAEKLAQKFRLDWNQELPGSDPRTPWRIASSWPTRTHLYPEDAPNMGAVLRAMSTWAVKSVSGLNSGSGQKLLLRLEGGQKVLMKPKWYSRDRVWKKDLCSMKDTHNGEIAAFHISRILGVRNVPLAAGRIIDVASEIKSRATQGLGLKDFQKIFKEKKKPIEVAIVLWTPDHVTFKQSEHPWGGVCNVQRGRFDYMLPGATDPASVCQATQNWAPFRAHHPGLFLDLVDAAILQYLTLNADRKMYLGTGTFSAYLPVLDNARSFGNPGKDVIEILAPLTDCCRVRESTYGRLQELQNGSLSHVLDYVTRGDPLYPLLSPGNLQALDRRLHQTLAHIRYCICKMGQEAVLIRDTAHDTPQQNVNTP